MTLFGTARTTAAPSAGQFGSARVANVPLAGQFGGLASAAWSPIELFQSGEGGAWYDPSDLSTLWEDDAGTTPASVNGVVGKMDDKSGNGNHATQGTAAAKPILRSSGGLYWLECDGVDDYLEMTGIAVSQRTLAAAVNHSSGGGPVDNLFGTGSNNDAMVFRTAADDVYFSVGADVLYNFKEINDIPAVVVGSQNATDGVLRYLGTETTQARAAASATFNRLFARATVNEWPGNFYGGVIRDAPTAGDELTELEAYLAVKIGI